MPTPDWMNVNEPGKSVTRARVPNGVEIDLMVLAPPAGNPLDGHAMFLQCVEQDPINTENDFHLSFQAGFGPDLADPSSESSMLVLNYPATEIDEFESMDFTEPKLDL